MTPETMRELEMAGLVIGFCLGVIVFFAVMSWAQQWKEPRE